MNDLEKLKQELKQEILEELKSYTSNRRIPGLEAVRKKWFNGPNSRDKYTDSLMYKMFKNDQHRVWESVRTLTRLIFSMKSQVRLSSVDQTDVERVADALCKLIYSLKQEIGSKKEET